MPDASFDARALYDSAWQHPGLAWLGALALLVVLGRRRPTGWVRAYALVFGFTTALDALCTGAFTPVPPALQSGVAIAFVIIGDLRLFALVEHAFGPTRAWWARALAWAFVVPVLQAVAIRAWPAAFTEPRWIYLIYELLFLALGLALRLVWLPRRGRAAPEGSRAERAWALGAVTWFVVQYALWATADVLILLGAEWALLLRIVPNALYYAGFPVFVVMTAPPRSSSPC